MNRFYRITAAAALACALSLCLNSCLNRNVKTSETQEEAVEEEPEFSPGDQVADKWLQKRGADTFFSVSPIGDDLFALMDGKSYKEGCPVAREDLRYLTVLHKDSLGRTLVGEMVVNKAIMKPPTPLRRCGWWTITMRTTRPQCWTTTRPPSTTGRAPIREG